MSEDFDRGGGCRFDAQPCMPRLRRPSPHLAVLPEGEATRAILEHLGRPKTGPVPRAHGPPGGLVVGPTWARTMMPGKLRAFLEFMRAANWVAPR